MSEWVKCTGVNGVSSFVNLAAVLTMTSYGTGTRLALLGNSQTYVDVAETPDEILALPRIGGGADLPPHERPVGSDESLFENPM
jgi:hypothetical protein